MLGGSGTSIKHCYKQGHNIILFECFNFLTKQWVVL